MFLRLGWSRSLNLIISDQGESPTAREYLPQELNGCAPSARIGFEGSERVGMHVGKRGVGVDRYFSERALAEELLALL